MPSVCDASRASGSHPQEDNIRWRRAPLTYSRISRCHTSAVGVVVALKRSHSSAPIRNQLTGLLWVGFPVAWESSFVEKSHCLSGMHTPRKEVVLTTMEHLYRQRGRIPLRNSMGECKTWYVLRNKCPIFRKCLVLILVRSRQVDDRLSDRVIGSTRSGTGLWEGAWLIRPGGASVA